MKALATLLIASFLFTFSFAQSDQANDKACWGQASAVFAQMGEMGPHSSSQENPRIGLKNLAQALFDAGVIAEPTLQALGTFVASELGLSIEACL